MIYDPASSLANPADQSVLLAAVGWAQGALLGTLATVIATIAIASIGLAMLWGRIELRRGMSVLVGCFILFGAAAIANGLRIAAFAVGANEGEIASVQASAPPLVSKPLTPQAPSDPYAGAAVPQ